MHNHLRLFLAALFILSLYFQATIANAQNTPSQTRFGVGITGLNYCNSMNAFIDYLFQSGHWVAASGSSPTYGPDGYPTSGSANLLNEPAGYINGAYQFYSEGLCDTYFNGPKDGSTLIPVY